MGHMIADELVSQVMAQVIGALLAALIAAIGVGGVFWRKLAVNDQQNKRMDEMSEAINALLELNEIMSRHQLEMSCDRALDRGCISLFDKQEIEKLYGQYKKMNWNGPGKVAYESIKDLPIREDCD